MAGDEAAASSAPAPVATDAVPAASTSTSPERKSGSPLAKPVEPLKRHTMQDRCFLKPSWCDICEGILIGNGFKCAGACGRKCHRGVGKGTFNCHASLLALPCDCSAKPIEEGSYRFGDLARQWGRDLKTQVKEQIMVEALKEQRKLGNVDKIKELAAEVRRRWDARAAKRYLVIGQVASMAFVHCLTYLLTLGLAAPFRGERAWRLACLEAAHSVNLLLLLEAGLAALVLFLARQAERYSEIIHAFFQEILYIDVHDLDIDFMDAGAALEGLMRAALLSTGALGAASAAVWLRELLLAAGG